MKKNDINLLVLSVLLSVSLAFNSIAGAEEQRRAFSRNYVGLGVEVYAPYQCYANESILVRVRVEALEDVANVSVTVFIWGSKSEGYEAWTTSFAVLNVEDLSRDEVFDDEYTVEVPADISPGLIYGVLSLDWSVCLQFPCEAKWDKPSLRVTYVKNKECENLETLNNELQTQYDLALREKQSTTTLLYMSFAAVLALILTTAYFAKKYRE